MHYPGPRCFKRRGSLFLSLGVPNFLQVHGVRSFLTCMFLHIGTVSAYSDGANAVSKNIFNAGGYEDDKDEGEWLLYTGAGGRDLSGNKRTNKVQSCDQEFEGANKALLKSCTDGLPVRVLRSHKEKRSSYAPQKYDASQSIRYDGIYRIVAAWRTAGHQGTHSCLATE